MSQTAAQKAEKAQKAAEKAASEAAAKQADAQSDENAPETQKIKFGRSHPGYAYWPGDTADLTAEHVTLLVEGGFAELVTEAADTTTPTE